jgi:3-hydroxyisobutyrate dehydrogenase
MPNSVFWPDSLNDEKEAMTVVTTQTPIGFVGLGNLGQPICLRLIDEGWTLRVFDTSAIRAEPLVQAGATLVGASDLAECRVICFAVPDDAAIRELLDAGLRDALTPDHTVVVHSTILPAIARELADEIGRSGAGFLDAPVSGGAGRARTGQLTLFVGGDDADLARVRPVLDSLAADIFTLGPVGAGSATKLANQLIMFSALAGVHEALALAASYGVDEERVLAAVETSTGDTWVGRNWGFFDRTARSYNSAGTRVSQRPWSKDLWEIVSAARQADLSLPVSGLLAQIMADVIEDHASDEKKGTSE